MIILSEYYTSNMALLTEPMLKLDVTFTGERYEVALPWKDSSLRLPDNYQLSLRSAVIAKEVEAAA